MPDTGADGPPPVSPIPPTPLRYAHLNIVTFQPGAVIPFVETHVMEHGLYVLEGKAVYNLNKDWVEVEAGDFMWLRAYCPRPAMPVAPAPSATCSTKTSTATPNCAAPVPSARRAKPFPPPLFQLGQNTPGAAGGRPPVSSSTIPENTSTNTLTNPRNTTISEIRILARKIAVVIKDLIFRDFPQQWTTLGNDLYHPMTGLWFSRR